MLRRTSSWLRAAVAKNLPPGLSSTLKAAAQGCRISPALASDVVEYFEARRLPAPGFPQLHAVLQRTSNRTILNEAQWLLSRKGRVRRCADHDLIYRHGRAAERLAFYGLSRLVHEASAARRAELARDLPDSDGPLARSTLDPACGFDLVDASEWEPVRDAMAEARACFAEPLTDTINPGKRSMRTARLPPDILHSRLMSLASEPAILRLASAYLGGLPILARINLLLSENNELQDNSSQFFHLDPEDFRQVKIFLLVSDVDEESGPLHLVRADVSERIQLKTGYRFTRLRDDQVYSIAREGYVLRCVGRAGTLAIADTSRCFHMGSRPGRKSRLVAMFQYVTPFATVFPIGQVEITSKFAKAAKELTKSEKLSETQAHLLGAHR
jgi:hypothetical protein